MPDIAWARQELGSKDFRFLRFIGLSNTARMKSKEVSEEKVVVIKPDMRHCLKRVYYTMKKRIDKTG